MGRCNCGVTACACAVTAGDGISISGNGGSTSAYIVSTDIGTGTDTSCQQVMACVCSNLGDGLTCDTTTLRADLSSDANNVVTFGDDGGLYVSSASAQAGITGGTGIILTGDQTDGYVVAADLNYAYGVTDTKSLATTADFWLTPSITAATDGFVATTDGTTTRITVPKAGIYLAQASFRFSVTGGFTANSATAQAGATLYCAVSGAGRGRVEAFTVTRNSTVIGHDYTIIDSLAEGGSIGFRATKGSGFAANPTATALWGIQYIGPAPVEAESLSLAEIIAREKAFDEQYED